MLSSNSKASSWGCTACYNYRRENMGGCGPKMAGIFHVAEEEAKSSLESSPENFRRKKAGYCSIGHETVEHLKTCPLGSEPI